MVLIFTFIIGLVILILVLHLKYIIRLWNFPPGPPSLPLIGCAPFLPSKSGSGTIVKCAKWIPKYGDIMGFKFGQTNMVVVHDFQKAKEIAFDERFATRTVDSDLINNLRGINGKSIGIVMTNGTPWKQIRTFSVQTLSRYFGTGKKFIESIISDEVDLLLQSFPMNQDFLVRLTFNTSIFNIIWRMVAGQRFEVI